MMIWTPLEGTLLTIEPACPATGRQKSARKSPVVSFRTVGVFGSTSGAPSRPPSARRKVTIAKMASPAYVGTLESMKSPVIEW